MLIDVHAHTSNKKLWNLHTETATIAKLEKLAEQFNVRKIVLMATYFPFKGSGLPNAELLQRIKGNDLFAMFGSLDVSNGMLNGIQELRELADRGEILGIKMYSGYQEFNPSSEEVFPVYELAREFNLPVMFHTGELHHCCPREKRAKSISMRL